MAHFGIAGLCVKLRNCQNITFIAQHQAVAFQMSAHAFNFANHAAAVNNFAAGRNGAGNRFGTAAVRIKHNPAADIKVRAFRRN